MLATDKEQPKLRSSFYYKKSFFSDRLSDIQYLERMGYRAVLFSITAKCPRSGRIGLKHNPSVINSTLSPNVSCRSQRVSVRGVEEVP